jgi:transcriptional regulator with XRE-family HTH domain
VYAIVTRRRVFDHRALRRLRRATGLSRDDFAQLARISTSSLAKYERAERMPRSDTLALLADALNCATDDLFRDAR